MWRATLKSLLGRKLRLVLTALAIVLGVGFMAGTLVLTDTATAAFDDLVGASYAKIDVVVQATAAFQPGPEGGGGGGGGEERNPIPQSVLTDVSAVPGVASAYGDVSGQAQIVDPVSGEAIHNGGAPTIGTSWNPATGLVFREGEAPSGPDEVAIDAATARDHDLHVGQQIDVITNAGSRPFGISGIVGQGDSDTFFGATVAVFDLPTAQKLFDREGTYDHVYVLRGDAVSVGQLRNAIAAVLPDGYEAISAQDAADQAAEQVRQGLSFLRIGLLVFAFVSVFVGAFIIFNTFNIIVTQRTRELGLLRALGASRRQILGSVLLEATIVGLIGSAAGLGVGLLLAIGLKRLLAGLGLELPPTGIVVSVKTVVISLLVGTIVTVIASVFPARRAARVTPVQALREGSGGQLPLRRRVILGSVVLAAGFIALGVGLFGGVSNAGAVVGLGAALTFIGVAAVTPLFARPLARFIGAPMRRLGIAGRLGRENAMRNPRRTASTAAALMIGLGLVAFVTVFASSLKASASAALDKTLRADLVLTGDQFSPFSPQLAKDLKTRPELAAVSEFRQGEVRVGAATAFASGVDPATIAQVADVPIDAGDIAALAEPDTISIFRGVAETKGLSVGDELTVEFARAGDVTFRVVAIHADNGLLGDYAISLDSYEQNFAQQLDLFVFVKAAEGVSPADAKAVVDEVAADYPSVRVQDQAEFKAEQAKAIDQVLAFVLVLLLLSVVIAVFGIVNTLGLSIYERTRELGLLRAVGMSRRQVRRMVRVEAVIVAVLGAVLGLVIGLFFGWALQRALADLGVDKLRVPLGQLLVYLAVAALCGVVAAVWPARRAANQDVLRAIAYE